MIRDRRGRRMAWGRSLLVLVVAVLLQVTVFDAVAFGGYARIDLPLVAVVAIAMGVRTEDAAVTGFAAGLAVDLFQVGPFGQYSLVYCLVAYVVAQTGRRLTTSVVSPASGSMLGETSEASSMVSKIGTRSLVAGTAAAAAWALISIVGTVVKPAVPSVFEVLAGVPLGTLAGAVVLIHPMGWLVGALGVARAGGVFVKDRGDRRIVPVGDHRPPSLSPVRRL